MESHLLLCRGEREGDLQAPFLAEHEAQLLGRAEALWVGGPEGRTRAGIRNGTEAVLMEEAVLTARLHCLCTSFSHALSVLLRGFAPARRHEHQTEFAPLPQPRFPENA